MAWTTPKTWSAGETLTAANFNTHIRDNLNAIGAHQRIRKTVTESLSSNTTLQDDDHLLFAVAANEVWAWQSVVSVTCDASGGIKFTFTAPSGATGHWNYRTPAPVGSSGGPAFTTTTAHTVTMTSGPHDLSGVVVNGATPGNITFQWAQQASSGAATQVLVDSFLIAHRIA